MFARNRMFRFLLWLLVSLGQGPAWGGSLVHYSLLETPPRSLPTRILVVPAEITVREMSAGGVVEKVPEWTAQASDNLSRAVQEVAAKRSDFQLVVLPQLSEEEQDLLEDYLATYLQVAFAAHAMTLADDPAWAHKRRHFDYTLGGGLKFLQDKCGADAALVIVGEDVVSSGGRKAAAVLAAMLGVGIPLGHSLVSVGVVDLANGDLLWMQHTMSLRYDLKDPEAARAMIQEILGGYPGLPPRQP